MTGLPNRKLLTDRLEHAISSAKRSKGKVAVMMLGLDRFSRIADSIDQETANLILCELTGRLGATVRTSDTLARIGDTQMVVVLENITGIKPSGIVAQQLSREVSRPIIVDGQTFNITASIGISLFPDDGGDAEALLRAASHAMHRAKLRGGDLYEYHVPEWNTQARELLTMEADLRAALDRNEFVLFYQPQVEMATGKVAGFEALVRWRHPQRGLVPPGDFISLAEETGVIVPLGEWVLHEACRQNMAWAKAGRPMVRMAVNISPRQFRREDIPGLVRRVLAATGHPPEYLELEITESMIMKDVDLAIEIMHGLSDLGVHLAIDDFGTGYSSLSYLKRFPVKRLKVDRSFVKDVLTDPNDAAIASAVVALAKRCSWRLSPRGSRRKDSWSFSWRRAAISTRAFCSAGRWRPSWLRNTWALRAGVIDRSGLRSLNPYAFLGSGLHTCKGLKRHFSPQLSHTEFLQLYNPDPYRLFPGFQLLRRLGRQRFLPRLVRPPQLAQTYFGFLQSLATSAWGALIFNSHRWRWCSSGLSQDFSSCTPLLPPWNCPPSVAKCP